MKKLFLVSLSLLILFSCVTKRDEADIANEFYNVGNAFFDLEDYDKAEDYYLRVLDIDQDFHKARYNLIYIYVHRKNFSKAENNVKYLQKRSEDNLFVKKLYAYIKYSEGELEDSLKIYKEIMITGDNSSEIKFNIAKLYFQLEDYPNSLKYLIELIGEGETLELYHMAGIVAKSAEDLVAAKDFYNNYVSLGGEDVQVLKELLNICYELKDFENQKSVLLKLSVLSDGEVKAGYLFEIATIYLLVDDNFGEGYRLLEESIAGGFSKKEQIAELLENPDLIEKDKIRVLFTEKILAE